MKSYESYLGYNYWVEDNPIASGGEGAVYAVHNNGNIVVKIYNPSKRTGQQEAKLKTMIEAKLHDDVAKQFAWPIDIVYDAGRFVGFIMKRIHGVPLNMIYSDRFSEMPLSRKITIAKNLCVAVHNLHLSEGVIGDMNPNNILVLPETGFVRLIDCDSFHITDSRCRTFRCEVAMPEYLAPSVSKKLARGENLRTAPLPTFTAESDSFSLAIHIFQLLMNGAHPFAIAVDCKANDISVTLPQPSDNIKSGVFPYHKCPKGYKLPIYAFSFGVLPKRIRKLFVKCFFDGEAVKPKEWFDTLSEYEKGLKACKVNPNHRFRKGLTKCPYCSNSIGFAKPIALMASAKKTQTKLKPSLVFGKLTFWVVTVSLSIIRQAIGYYLVGFDSQAIGYIASLIGFSCSGISPGLLNINCAFGLLGTLVYNIIASKKEVHFINYYVSKLFAAFGFLLGFTVYSGVL